VFLPATQRDVVSRVLLNQYLEAVPAQGRRTADRWFVEHACQYGWQTIRWAALIVLWSFLVGGGLDVRWPTGDEGWGTWLRVTWPAWALCMAGARTGWLTRSAWAGLLSGLSASFLVTLAVQVVYVASLAIGQPQLFRLGLSWASAHDLWTILATNTLTGTAVSTVGGLVGAGARAVRARFGP
jgi:hypothetical protein